MSAPDLGKPLTYLEAIRAALWNEMERDERVFMLGEDIGLYGGAFKLTDGMQAQFGAERVLDTPISEAAIVGAAIGATYLGMRPVAEIQFMDFVSNAFNMLVNFAAKSHYRLGVPSPIVVRGPVGGGVHAGPFHSQNPEMWFVHTPGLKVAVPSTPADAYGLLRTAIQDPDPVLFLEHKMLYRLPRIREAVPSADHAVPFGEGTIRRSGSDLTLVTYGAMVLTALDAADALAREGTSVEVIDLRTLVPWDRALVLESVRRTGKLLLLHEATRTGGFAGEVAAVVAEEAFDDLDGPIVRITAPDTPVPYATSLEKVFIPSVERVVGAARELRSY